MENNSAFSKNPVQRVRKKGVFKKINLFIKND